MITPKYLTEEMGQCAVSCALQAVTARSDQFPPILTREELAAGCHIRVLVPCREKPLCADRIGLHGLIQGGYLLYAHHVGDPGDWKYPFDHIAESKGYQLWTGRNDDGGGVIPHLLFPGDAPFWGGVKRQGIVVTCSGFEQHVDKLVSGITADVLIAQGYDAFEKDKERERGGKNHPFLAE